MPSGLSTRPGQNYIEIKLQPLPEGQTSVRLQQFNIRPPLNQFSLDEEKG